MRTTEALLSFLKQTPARREARDMFRSHQIPLRRQTIRRAHSSINTFTGWTGFAMKGSEVIVVPGRAGGEHVANINISHMHILRSRPWLNQGPAQAQYLFALRIIHLRL
jgi:hypothetical protein